MKKLTFLGLLFLTGLLNAQDIIYTVSGEYNETKVVLDSILVENLTNDTRILFGDLPEHEYYQINLTKNAYWGTVGINDISDDVPAFTALSNTPGQLTIAYQKNTPIEIKISIFNINGQIVYASTKQLFVLRNSVDVALSHSGVYFVRVESQFGSQTFKAIGADNINEHGIEISARNKKKIKLKSGLLNLDSDFNYTPGDSIRVSAYKDEYYARPQGFKIYGSQDVDFIFGESEVNKSGISDAYIALDEVSTNVSTYDTITGDVKIDYTGDKPEILAGDIITVDVDTMGYLRKVIKAEGEDGTITVQTEQAYLNDVFVEMDFKLHTGLIEPVEILKSNSTPEEISKALTDNDGFIHPAEIVYHKKDGTSITKSAITTNDDIKDTIPIIDFYQDLSADLYGKEGDDIHFYVDTGHVILTSNAIYEFNFDYDGELTEDTKIKKGQLNTFSFYLDSDAKFLTMLALDMSQSWEKEKEKKLVDDVVKTTAKFFVLSVPVWITFEVDIFGAYHVAADASLHADWGFESNHNLKVGALYDNVNETLTPIKEYTPKDTIFPLNLEGEINAFARMEVYPHVEARFYSFYGPYAHIVPYVKGNYNAAFQTQITSGGSETFLAWNSGIDVGLDFRVGSTLKFLGLFDKDYGPNTINCFETPIWQTPTDVSLVTELPEEADGGAVQSLKFKVTDLFGYNVPLCPIYISGDGEFNKEILTTDINGEDTVNWTLLNTEGESDFNATIYKSDKTVIGMINGSIFVNAISNIETGTLYDERDSTTYKTVKIGDQWWMAENLAYLPKVNPPQEDSWREEYYTDPFYYVYKFKGTSVDEAKTNSNYQTFGVLYNWPAAKNACPEGWKLPTIEDWNQLAKYISDDNGDTEKIEEDYYLRWIEIAKFIKTDNSNYFYFNGSDKYKFNCLPGGWYRSGPNVFSDLEISCFFWTNTELGYTHSNYISLHYNNDDIYISNMEKSMGLSVRCIQDE